MTYFQRQTTCTNKTAYTSPTAILHEILQMQNVQIHSLN